MESFEIKLDGVPFAKGCDPLLGVHLSMGFPIYELPSISARLTDMVFDTITKMFTMCPGITKDDADEFKRAIMDFASCNT